MMEQLILNEIKVLEDIILMREMHDMGLISDDTYKSYLHKMAIYEMENLNDVDKA